MTSPLARTPDPPPDAGDSDRDSDREWGIYAEGVRFLALRALGDPDAADDVAQEAVLRAWRGSIERKRSAIADPVAFIYGIARHVIADTRRQSRHAVSLEATESIPASDRDVLEALASDEERASVRAALRRLPRAERTVLVMSYVEGLTSAAIALRLGESADAIRKRKSRAIQRLRNAFGAR